MISIKRIIRKILKEDLKVGDHVKISKYEKGFANVYVPNWYDEVFVII